MPLKRIPREELTVVVLDEDPRFDAVATERPSPHPYPGTTRWDGWWLRSPFFVRWEDRKRGRTVEVEAIVDDDRMPLPVAVRIEPPAKAADFKELPLTSLLYAAVELVGAPGPKYPPGTRMRHVEKPVDRGWFGVHMAEARPRTKDEARAAHPVRLRPPYRITDEWLQQIVDLRHKLEERGIPPKPAIAERTGRHVQTVAKWFQLARKRDLLEEYEPKRGTGKGGQR